MHSANPAPPSEGARVGADRAMSDHVVGNVFSTNLECRLVKEGVSVRVADALQGDVPGISDCRFFEQASVFTAGLPRKARVGGLPQNPLECSPCILDCKQVPAMTA